MLQIIGLLFNFCFLQSSSCFFFFNDPATTEIYTLSLHDALPIFVDRPDLEMVLEVGAHSRKAMDRLDADLPERLGIADPRSEEHTSELQSRFDLVCRLLLEKKKKKKQTTSQPVCLQFLMNSILYY